MTYRSFLSSTPKKVILPALLVGAFTDIKVNVSLPLLPKPNMLSFLKKL